MTNIWLLKKFHDCKKLTSQCIHHHSFERTMRNQLHDRQNENESHLLSWNQVPTSHQISSMDLTWVKEIENYNCNVMWKTTTRGMSPLQRLWTYIVSNTNKSSNFRYLQIRWRSSSYTLERHMICHLWSLSYISLESWIKQMRTFDLSSVKTAINFFT